MTLQEQLGLIQFIEGITITDNFDEIGEEAFAALALDALAVSKQATNVNPSIDK